MNPKNYCTQPYAQKLVDAGIILGTDTEWCKLDHITWELRYKNLWNGKKIPAPLFQDVWDELPKILNINNLWHEKRLISIDNLDIAGYWYNTEVLIQFAEVNPTNAAIGLLVWVKEQGK
jgi:hypothetical protein